MLKALFQRLFRSPRKAQPKKAPPRKTAARKPAEPPSLAELEDEMVGRRTDLPTDDTPPPVPERAQTAEARRRALIDQAMAVHRDRQAVLDDLDDAERVALKMLADKVLGDKVPGGGDGKG